MLEMLFPANQLASTKKAKSKPGETTTKIQTQANAETKYNITQYSHAPETQNYYNTK